MTKYRPWERGISNILGRFPKLKSLAKRVYEKLNFSLYGEKGFLFSINKNTVLHNVAEKLPILDKKKSFGNFFGYYDKTPWDETGDFFLFQRITACDNIELVFANIIKMEAQVFATTAAWTFQQGAMLQWANWGAPRTVVFNSVSDEVLGCRKLSLFTGESDFSTWPIQCLHPREPKFVSINFPWLGKIGSDYGYNLQCRNLKNFYSDSNNGLWFISWPNKIEWFLSLEKLKNFFPRVEMNGAVHHVNHALFSPNGQKIIFMHRWQGGYGWFSRLFVINEDGTGLSLLLDNEMVSHYAWKNDSEILVWGRGEDKKDHYLLVSVVSRKVEILNEGAFDHLGDGHPSISRCGRFMVVDSYPDRKRQRNLSLIDFKESKLVPLGKFLEPLFFSDARRCDLHPRFSPNGKEISFDSAFSGKRNTYILNIEKLI